MLGLARRVITEAQLERPPPVAASLSRCDRKERRCETAKARESHEVQRGGMFARQMNTAAQREPASAETIS